MWWTILKFRVNRKIIIRYKKLFKLSNEMQTLCREQIVNKIHWNYSELHFFTVNILSRNLHKLQSIDLLVKNGLSSDGWLILRSILESSLDYGYIMRHPEKLQLYLEYSIYLDIKNIKRHMINETLSDEQNTILIDLQNKWDAVKHKFTNKYGIVRTAWRDKSLSDLAKEAGSEDLYSKMYQEANDHIHDNSNMIQLFIKGKNKKGLLVKAGPTIDHTDICLVLSINYMFLSMLFIADKEYQLGLTQKLRRIKATYDELFSQELVRVKSSRLNI